MELYYEQNVVNSNIDDNAKKSKTLEIAKYICIVIAICTAMSSLLFIFDKDNRIMAIVALAAAVPFVIAALLIALFNKKNNTEYDYILDNDELNISAVYFRARRKLLYTVKLKSVESIGVFESDGYKKAAATADKKQLALVNYENEKSVLYILYSTDKGKRILFIEPDRGFLVTLKRALPTFSVFDGSISELEKYLNEKYIAETSHGFGSASEHNSEKHDEDGEQ